MIDDLLNKLNNKIDEEGYLPYYYARPVEGGWIEGLIHISYLRNYLDPYETLDEAIENTKSEGLKLLLIDYKKLH